jgi:hypothetical protein
MTERPKMNQRLSAIKQQAHLYALDQEWYVDSFEQRFAELIVKECADVIDEVQTEGGDFIRRHFGVEE